MLLSCSLIIKINGRHDTALPLPPFGIPLHFQRCLFAETDKGGGFRRTECRLTGYIHLVSVSEQDRLYFQGSWLNDSLIHFNFSLESFL